MLFSFRRNFAIVQPCSALCPVQGSLQNVEVQDSGESGEVPQEHTEQCKLAYAFEAASDPQSAQMMRTL